MQFAEALLEYHKQCSEILQVCPSGKITFNFDALALQGLTETLYQKTNLASGRQRREFVPKTLEVHLS